MSQAAVNGQWGRMYSHDDDAYLPLRIVAGEAEIDGQTIELVFTSAGEMMAINKGTKKSFILPWQDFLDLAIAAGLNQSVQSE